MAVQSSNEESSRLRTAQASIMVCAVGAVWAMALIQWGQPLNWDEIEFFRATRWIAEGRLPFRDYWEHHLPLQWLLFAPAAFAFGDGAGVGAVVAMRWAQLPLWIGTAALVMAISRKAGVAADARWGALALLVSSPWFVRTAVQYRVDVPGHLAFIGAVWLFTADEQRIWRGYAAGALFSLAVLANLRLAPLVVMTVLLSAFWRAGERRWVPNGAVLRVIAGGAAVAALFIAYLRVTGSTEDFLEGVIWYNTAAGRLVPKGASSFLRQLVAPIVQREVAGTGFLIAGATGVTMALRSIRRPGVLQIAALLALASVAAIAPMAVQYEYHVQTSLILLVPLAASALAQLRGAMKWIPTMIAGVGLALYVIGGLASHSHAALAYQDRVMMETNRLTREEDRVWDGCGYALRREPAYRYWFLPAGVRLLADEGLIENYDIEEIAANPPAVVVFNARTRFWMLGRPRLAQYVTHHYVPLYQNLWIPGMSAVVGPEPSQVTWTVLRSGRYDVHASELLTKHPWFVRPLDYGVMEGAELAIPLDRLPPATSLRWRVNGVPIDESTTLELQAGARLELLSMSPRRVGVIVVPHGVTTLSIMPETPFVF